MPTPSDALLTFFVDRSLGAHDVPHALRTAGALVEIHDDHFAPDTPDTVWLAEVGARGWVVLADVRPAAPSPPEFGNVFAEPIG